MGKNTCDCNIIHFDLVENAKRTILNESDLNKITNIYKALADSTRIRIINILQNNALCVCDICSILNMTKSAVSHQLKYLKERKLIKCTRKGKEIWYSLSDCHVEQVFEISLQHIREK